MSNSGIGAIMQLSKKGPEDQHMNDDPEMTFLSPAYAQHTPFGFCEETILVATSPEWSALSKVEVKSVPTFGDMMIGMTLELHFPDLSGLGQNYDGVDHVFRYVDHLAHAYVDKVALLLDGERVEVTGEYMHIRSRIVEGACTPAAGAATAGCCSVPPLFVDVKLPCFVSTGLGLPLVALTGSDVRFEIEFSTLQTCVRAATISSDGTATISGTEWNNVFSAALQSFPSPDVYVHGTFVSLSAEEKTHLRTSPLEYVYESTRTMVSPLVLDDSAPSGQFSYRLNSDIGLCSHMLFYTKRQHLKRTDWDPFNFSATPSSVTHSHHAVGADSSLISRATLLMNSYPRQQRRTWDYYSLQHMMSRNIAPYTGRSVGAFIFAMHPCSVQPSGMCNFRRLTSVRLLFDVARPSGAGANVNAYDVVVVTVGYDVLRVYNGKGYLIMRSPPYE